MTRPIVLKDAHKRFTADQDKVLAPSETVRRFKEKLQMLDLDILSHTRRIDNGRLGIPVYLSRCGKDAAAMIGTGKQMGKGATPAQAEASAVMELAERYSFFSFSKNPDHFIRRSYAQLSGPKIDFRWIARSVNDSSGDLPAARELFERLPLNWTGAYNLTRGEATQIPFDWFFAINEFNGSSAGNCVEEALCQGMCEIVERHVSAVASRDQRELPAIDPDSATDPMVREMLGKYRAAKIKFHLSDFTLDMGIPTVGVLAWDPNTFPEHSEIVWTAGTTPDPQKALSRALTEVAQLAGDFETGAHYVASGLPKPASIREAKAISSASGPVDIFSLPDVSDANIRIEVENIVAALAHRGLEVFVVDITHPDLAVPAFYALVPGTHFRERAAGAGVGMFTAKLIAENLPPQTAIAELEAFERRLPGKYYLRFYLGTAHLAMGRPERALEQYRLALDLEPIAQDTAAIYAYMGICLKDMGRYKEAIAALESGAAHDAERTDIHNLLGFCHFKRKEHEKAIAAFQRVIRLNPGSAIDYANIGSNYRELGDRQKAIEFYETALALDPTIDFALDNLLKLKGN